MNIIEDLKREFKQGTALNRIIYINVGVFVVVRLIVATMQIFFGIEGENAEAEVLAWLAIPSLPAELLAHIWTPLTYMFTHFSILHLLMNLLWLYWFSKFFLQLFKGSDLVSLYITGGLSGALFYFLAINYLPFFNDHNIMIGASGSVLAIVIATAVKAPNHEINLLFSIKVKLKHLALAVIFIDYISIVKGNAGGHLAHLGGAFWGWLFVVSQRKGLDLIGWLGRFIAFFERAFAPRPKSNMKVKWNRPKTDQQWRTERKVNTQEIDVILDKIKHSGYDSLSKEEKQKLFNASNN